MHFTPDFEVFKTYVGNTPDMWSVTHLSYCLFQAVHNKLMEEYGMPTWGSYLIFAVATIIIGALLGLVSFFYIEEHCSLNVMTCH